MHLYRGITLLMVLLLLGCTEGIDQNMLVGKWKAALLMDRTEKSGIDLSAVQFEFKANNTYSYQSNLKYKEAGRYSTMGKTLYSTDTTVVDQREKAVKIVRLSADSLFLEMNNSGTPQLLKLYKVAQ